MILSVWMISITVQSGTVDLGGGLGIALVGMVTVFTGLLCLSFLLPILENLVENGFRLKKSKDRQGFHSQKKNRKLSQEEIAAISAAIHSHLCLLDRVENMKLTWETHERPYTPWRLAGRAEHMQETGSLQNRIRSR